jgi:LysR family hydrogen peroxide-inducible transcriptional activator
MNIQQLEYIEAVSELQSFDKAAERCFVTQSTLSTMVSKLEKEIGMVLFDRKTKPITVTPEGAEVIRQAQVILREIGNLNQLIGNLKGETEGDIRIAAIPTVSAFLFPLFLKQFVNDHPKVQFSISEAITENIIADLKSRKIDVGILSTPIGDDELLEFQLYREPFLLFDGDGKSDQEKAVRIEDIDIKRMWLLEEGHCMRSQVSHLCSLRKDSRLNLSYKTGTIDTLRRFVRLNGGLTLMPQLATIDFSPEERALLRYFAEPEPVREISLVVHRHFIKKGMLESLRQAILEAVGHLIKGKSEVRILRPA